MIVEGFTEAEIQCLLAACDLTDAIIEGLAEREDREPGPSARDTARTKLIVTLGTQREAMTGMPCFN
jgi:hypothetical protein